MREPFARFLVAMIDLAMLESNGDEDTPEADDIREASCEDWYALTKREKEVAREISKLLDDKE